jgi:hypothetical protein
MTSIAWHRGRTPFNVPARAIYSKIDSVVAWKACIDEDTAEIEYHGVDRGVSGERLRSNVIVFRLVPKLLKEPT